MQFAGLKYQLVGGGWLHSSLGTEAIAPGDHVAQVAPAKHMETLQQFGFSVEVKIDRTGEVVFQLPESLFSSTVGVAIVAETRVGNYKAEL